MLGIVLNVFDHDAVERLRVINADHAHLSVAKMHGVSMSTVFDSDDGNGTNPKESRYSRYWTIRRGMVSPILPALAIAEFVDVSYIIIVAR